MAIPPMVSVAGGGGVKSLTTTGVFAFGPITPGTMISFLHYVLKIQGAAFNSRTTAFPTLSIRAFKNVPVSDTDFPNAGRQIAETFDMPVGSLDDTATTAVDGGAGIGRIPIPPLEPGERFLGLSFTAAASTSRGWIAAQVERDWSLDLPGRIVPPPTG